MRRTWFLLLCFLLTSPAGFGQTSSTEAPTLQALLAEVRQLRQDLRTATATSQRVQILLQPVQGQEAAVARASQRLDDTRAKLAETQANRRRQATFLKQNEDFASNSENSPAARKEAEDVISRVKPELERLGDEEQQRQSRKIEAEEQLRLGQAKLGELQDQLDRLDKSLENPNR